MSRVFAGAVAIRLHIIYIVACIYAAKMRPTTGTGIMTKKMHVGVEGNSYVNERLLSNVGDGSWELRHTRGLLTYVNYVNRKVLHHHHATTFTNCFSWHPGIPPRDLLHFVNTIAATTTPWIVSFEHFLPRWDPASRFGMQLLAGSHCKRILAISQFAYDSQVELLAPFSTLAPSITRKMQVLHPPQPLLIGSLDEKHTPQDLLRCVFVGRDFFRKGGREIVDAVQLLIGEGRALQVDIVSSVDPGDYATKSTAADRDEILRRMEALRPAIQFHGEVPNAEVLTMLRNSHVALLPTYDDTYGFSVLEAQAAGTPVITTDICALSEINTENVGWIIRLRKDKWRQAEGIKSGDIATISQEIRTGIYEHLRAILDHPEMLKARSVACLERIRTHHDPARYGQTIRAIYQESVGA